MKTLTLISLLILTATTASAHVEVGTYTGKTTNGEICSIQSFETTFENNAPHPLNERVRIQLGDEVFVLSHPAVVDAAQGVAHFNHDVLQGVNPTSKGARAFVLNMIHTPEQDGPGSFSIVDHQWKANIRSTLTCEGLQFTAK